MNDVLKASRWETVIGGVTFKSYRRNTAVMSRAHGFLAVCGQLGAVDDAAPVTASDYQKFCEAVMRAAVIEPVIAPVGEPTIPGVQYAFRDLEFAADKWITEFMETGLPADPTPPSCEA
jgi:hypothetical protein